MKLPNPERAIIGNKLERYCLNFDHPVGKHKALLFQRRFGITLVNKDVLEYALLRTICDKEALLYKEDAWGIHYDIEFYFLTALYRSLVRSSWIIRVQEDFPRLTNVYPVSDPIDI